MMSNLRQEPRWEGGATGHDRDSIFCSLPAISCVHPVRAAIVKHPRLWAWSSYGSMIGVTMVAEYTGLRARMFCTNLLLRKITTLSIEP
jgi:hypothetical protein